MWAGVPPDASKALHAGQWANAALGPLGGKGGGKPTNAQGQGSKVRCCNDAPLLADSTPERLHTSQGTVC